jgi:hypothetical protein
MTDLQFSHILMYDAVEPADIPPSPGAVAAYVDGRWPTLAAVRTRFPSAWVLPIAVSEHGTAMVLDVETGDATSAGAARWLARMRQIGLKHPCLYTSLGSLLGLVTDLERLGWPRASYWLWTAHWTGHAHICSASACGIRCDPPGATQYANYEHLGFDESLVGRGWLLSLLEEWAALGALGEDPEQPTGGPADAVA